MQFLILGNLSTAKQQTGLYVVVGNLAGHSVPKSSLVIPWINNQGSPALLIKSSSFWFSIFSPSLTPSFSSRLLIRPGLRFPLHVWYEIIRATCQAAGVREQCCWIRLQPEPRHRLSHKREANRSKLKDIRPVKYIILFKISKMQLKGEAVWIKIKNDIMNYWLHITASLLALKTCLKASLLSKQK